MATGPSSSTTDGAGTPVDITPTSTAPLDITPTSTAPLDLTLTANGHGLARPVLIGWIPGRREARLP
jgi:hypothetical protein